MSLRQTLNRQRLSEDAQQLSGYGHPPSPHRQVRPEEVLRGLLISAIVMVSGIVMGYFTQSELLRRGTAYFVLAAGAGVLLAAVAYRRIELVMLAYIGVIWVAIGATPDLINGVSSGTGKGIALSHIGMTFLLFIWGLRAVALGQTSFARLPLNGLLILFLAFNVWSAVSGLLFWDPALAQFYQGMGDPTGGRTSPVVVFFEVFVRALLVGAFWLFANNLRDEKWVRRVSWLLLLPGAAVLLVAVGHLPLKAGGYAVLQEIIVACTLFAWLLEPRAADTPPRRGLRLLAWLVLALIVFHVFRLNIRWVSGWFGLFCGLYIVAFLRSKRLFAVLLAVGLVLYVAGHAFLQQNVVHKVQTSGDMARFDMARASVYYALRFPLGVGPGNYRAYNLYYGGLTMWKTTTFSSAHGFYSQMLSELGFGGLILTALFVLTALTMVARFYRRMPPGPSRTFVLGLAGMWGGISAASGIGDYLIPVYHNGGVYSLSTAIYAWIGLGVAVAHARLYGLVSDEKPRAIAAQIPPAAEFYPRKMGRDSV
ncbi:MAG: hypothetical protein JO250_01155 [Armatimonadetes bacterium]|nr:hypothetical protein [Armatimonadota bacterium]